MPPVLTVIRWRDIPAQVVAKDGRRTARRELHRRFQVAIDRAALRAGKRGASDYIGEWASDRRRCGGDLEAEVRAAAERLEAEHPRDVLSRLVEQGGWADPAAHPPDAPATGAGRAAGAGSATPDAPGDAPAPRAEGIASTATADTEEAR